MAGNDEYTVLLIHSNTTDGSTTFEDSGVGVNCPHSITVSGVTHETEQYKFGTSSIYFDGTNATLSLADSEDWTYGTGDFTLDFWFRMPVLPVSGGAITCPLFDQGGHFRLKYIWHSGISALRFHLFLTGATPTDYYWTVDLLANTWHHIALVKSGSALKLFVDGTQVGSDLAISGTLYNSTSALKIGSFDTLTFVAAYLDEIRISKGIARWTTNFTPPTEAYIYLAPITASAVFTEDIDTISSEGTIELGGHAYLIDEVDALYLTGAYYLELVEQYDQLSCSGVVGIAGDFSITEDNDALSMVQGAIFTLTDSIDYFTLEGIGAVTSSLVFVESADKLRLEHSRSYEATAAWDEELDELHFIQQHTITSSIGFQEKSDIVTLKLTESKLAFLSTYEQQDVINLIGYLNLECNISLSDGVDCIQFIGFPPNRLSSTILQYQR